MVVMAAGGSVVRGGVVSRCSKDVRRGSDGLTNGMMSVVPVWTKKDKLKPVLVVLGREWAEAYWPRELSFVAVLVASFDPGVRGRVRAYEKLQGRISRVQVGKFL